MNRTTCQVGSALIAAALLAGAWSADGAVVNNGDPVGPNYKIQGIDVAGSVDFTAHAPVPGTDEGQNNNTIGKLTLTLNHAALVWQGFSLQWYCCAPQSVARDPTLRGALAQSLKLSLQTMLIAVPLGVAFAIGVDRWRKRTATGAPSGMSLPRSPCG